MLYFAGWVLVGGPSTQRCYIPEEYIVVVDRSTEWWDRRAERRGCWAFPRGDLVAKEAQGSTKEGVDPRWSVIELYSQSGYAIPQQENAERDLLEGGRNFTVVRVHI
jgi:hypothetical protein